MSNISERSFINRAIITAIMVPVASYIYFQLIENPLGDSSQLETTVEEPFEHQSVQKKPPTQAKTDTIRVAPPQIVSQQVPSTTPLDDQELIEEYRVWPDDQIDAEIATLEEELDFGRYLERANGGQLDHDEMQKFSDLLITIDSLRHVRNERQLAELEALVNSPPVPANPENP